jgi:hypothetical protein
VPRSRELEPRWALAATIELSKRENETFLALPAFERLSFEEALARVEVPLERDPRDSDPAYWWSRTYSIPSGRFRLLGVPEATGICNGEGCFSEGEQDFSSGVALAQFRLRAPALPDSPRLRLLEPRGRGPEALRTVRLGERHRLHGLDDAAYLDPAGFWVKASSSAAFALEALEGAVGNVRIRIANGGVPNRVGLEAPRSKESFALAPWEEREILVAGEEAVILFNVRSEGGFRPADVDPGSRDRRRLGVLLRADPAFD